MQDFEREVVPSVLLSVPGMGKWRSRELSTIYYAWGYWMAFLNCTLAWTYCNLRTSSKWFYPLYKILNCFSETVEQNHKSYRWSNLRGENVDIQLHLEPKSCALPALQNQRTRTEPKLEHRNPCRSRGSWSRKTLCWHPLLWMTGSKVL